MRSKKAKGDAMDRRLVGALIVILIVAAGLIAAAALQQPPKNVQLITKTWVTEQASAIFDEVRAAAVAGKLVTVEVGALVAATGKVDWRETTGLFYRMACTIHEADASMALSLRAYQGDEVVVSANGTPAGLANLVCEDGGLMRPLEVFDQYYVADRKSVV